MPTPPPDAVGARGVGREVARLVHRETAARHRIDASPSGPMIRRRRSLTSVRCSSRACFGAKAGLQQARWGRLALVGATARPCWSVGARRVFG